MCTNLYVTPHMGTNSVLLRGVPKWEFLSRPARLNMGTPRMETGTVFLAGHWVTHQAPSHCQKNWPPKTFPYGDPHMKTGIDTSLYGNGESPFPFGDLKNMSPCFHMGIPIWKRGLAHPWMEKGACFAVRKIWQRNLSMNWECVRGKAVFLSKKSFFLPKTVIFLVKNPIFLSKKNNFLDDFTVELCMSHTC